MADLADFLDRLFNQGEVIFQERPVSGKDQSGTTDLLRRAHAQELLEIAGPPLEFRPTPALAAAELVRQACWFLVQREQPAEDVERHLGLDPPAVADDHLSADLTLRYLPQVHRRARALVPDDPLTQRLAQVLRQWPLSGVLSDLPGRPLTPPDFGHHPGLLLLYAERFVANHKAEWLPDGRGLEFVELVLHDRNEQSVLLGRGRNSDDGK
jgi:hypothetical protein